ncbi:MAG: YceI family protein [Chthoniobacterales bacterium]
MAHYALVILILLSLADAVPAAEKYAIDPTRSRIAFRVSHLLGTARGEFRKFSGTIEVEPSQPERSSVSVKIRVDSIDTKIQKRDEHLLSAAFFDANKFPEITFRSRGIRRTGPETGEIIGDLTMHGATREIVLKVKLTSSRSTASVPNRTRWLVTTAPLQRKDFGLAFGSTAEALSGIGQDVVPTIEIEAVREP